jgi:hypothetical protein
MPTISAKPVYRNPSEGHFPPRTHVRIAAGFLLAALLVGLIGGCARSAATANTAPVPPPPSLPDGVLTAPFKGPADAKVIVTVFEDYQ